MTANDLADRLEQFYQGTHIDKAAETLRQQAQEIKNCNMDIDALKTFNNDLEQEIEALKKELALQRLSNISQEIETLDTRSYLIGRYDGLEKDELKQLVKSFFEDYLDYQEESDSGRLFNPIHVSCTRVMMIEPLAKLLVRMRELAQVDTNPKKS